MKFKENSWSSRTYESKKDYFDERANDAQRLSSGEIETLRDRIDFLEEVIGRLLDHLPLSLEQLSDIVDGYDRELEDLDE